MDVQSFDLPAAVRDAVYKKYLGATISRAEMSKSNGKSVYEIQMTAGID
jgi:hypothetical protein